MPRLRITPAIPPSQQDLVDVHVRGGVREATRRLRKVGWDDTKEFDEARRKLLEAAEDGKLYGTPYSQIVNAVKEGLRS